MLRKRARFSPFRPYVGPCVGSRDSVTPISSGIGSRDSVTPTSSGSVAAVWLGCLWDSDFVSQSFCVGVGTHTRLSGTRWFGLESRARASL
eukprot:scaffold424_cov69-Phaeocystis_antarctica.AAC.9